MSRLLIILLTLCVASIAMADDFSAERTVPFKSNSHVLQNPGQDDGRQGGETIADAVMIGALPYSDAGNTSGNIDDYDEVCPYSGSTAPDVVYSYSPAAFEMVTVDLCYSMYDTKVFVYANGWTPGLPYACNDDFWFADPCYTYSSLVEFLAEPGNTYYIVVDGYFGDMGDYVMDVTSAPYEPCIGVTCHPSALDEGEPTLVPDYVDNYNGGCNATPYVFQDIDWVDETGCAHMAGVAGWYPYQGTDYRDLDWIEVVAQDSEVTVKVEFANDITTNIIGISTAGPDCAALEFIVIDGTLEGCTEYEFSFAATPGDIHWVICGAGDWVTTTAEFDYCLEICGIEGVVGTEDASWGSVKSMYR